MGNDQRMTDQELDYIIENGTDDEVANAMLIQSQRYPPEVKAALKKAKTNLMKLLDREKGGE